MSALALCFVVLTSQIAFAQQASTVDRGTARKLPTTSVNSKGASAPQTFTPQVVNTFSNPAPITIADTPLPPTPAVPYPATVVVSGIAGPISKVTVTLTGVSHTFPDDIDMLLVSPGGQNYHIWSDVCGSTAISNLNITLDDAAASALPDTGPCTSGTFRPFNATASDVFPAPAPAGPYNEPPSAGTATFATAFNSMTPAQANGTWNLYITDDLSGDAGSISGGWSLSITSTAPPPAAGDLIISEFRLRGPNGANDEFIELYNTTGSAITVADIGAGAGFGVVASDGTLRCTVPNGTVIPSRGHYLCANSVGYSLASYPAGNGTTATANATYTTDIPDNAGIALFDSTLAANFVVANRLDAVGSTSEANTLYKEGIGYPALSALPVDYSFFRNLASGTPKDTNNNSADFVFADTANTNAGAGQRLGAPGPENLSSPIQRNATIKSLYVDLGCTTTSTGAGAASNNTCARHRDTTPDVANNSTFGTLSIRRTWKNNTGAAVTRLRFRIVDITTQPQPVGTADLRARTSSNYTATCVSTGGGCTAAGQIITINGTTLETPPAQPSGGGLNSSLSAGTIALATPLANGASINLQFLLGVQQNGGYRFFINIEALP